MITIIFAARCIVETLYNTTCIKSFFLRDSVYQRITRTDITSCLLDHDNGFGSV